MNTEKKRLRSFKDLIVWQKAVGLATVIYQVTEKFPHSELYGLANQMRRATVSISSNIAEGFKRSHEKEKIQFYQIAYGSVAELESQTEIAKNLKFLGEADYQKLIKDITEISKMTDSFIRAVRFRQG